MEKRARLESFLPVEWPSTVRSSIPRGGDRDRHPPWKSQPRWKQNEPNRSTTGNRETSPGVWWRLIAWSLCGKKKSYRTRSWPNKTFWQPCLAQAPNRFICPSSQLKALSWWGCPTARLSSASTMSTGYKGTIRCSSWVYRGESIYMVMALLVWLLTTVESGMEYLMIFNGWSSLQQTSSFPLLCTPSQRHLVGWAVFFASKSDSGASGDSRFIESSSASDF